MVSTDRELARSILETGQGPVLSSAMAVRFAGLSARLKSRPTAWVALVPLGSTGMAIGLWLFSLPRIDAREIGDFGLASALPPAWFAAVAMLNGSFCLALARRRTAPAVLLLHLVGLIVVVHGTLACVYEEPRYAWTYKHIGVTDYLQRQGTIEPSLDIYQNWPGFFALAALLNGVAGMPDAMQYAAWAPLFFNLLYVGPLAMCLKALTGDRRTVWLGLWLFYLTSWVGQDYFAPQALGYFFFLTILGVCLSLFRAGKSRIAVAPGQRLRSRVVPREIATWLRAGGGAASEPVPTNWQRLGGMVVVVLVFAAVVATHQLTPFMILACVTALVVCRCCSARWLPVLMAVIVCTWLVYMAVAFLGGNLRWIVGALGHLDENLESNVVSLGTASAGRAFVALTCRALTVAVWGLGLCGALRRARSGHLDLAAAVIALVPFPMLALQAYGGEMLFRIYFFTLPGMVFFVASLLRPTEKRAWSWKTTAATLAVTSALFGAFMFAYYGNERINNFTHDEVAAARYVYETAPSGSLILTGSWNTPMRFARYEQFGYLWISDMPEFRGRHLGPPDLDALARIMGNGEYPESYFVITRSQKEHAALFGLFPRGDLDSLEKAVESSDRFVTVLSNRDARVFMLADRAAGVGRAGVTGVSIPRTESRELADVGRE